MSFRILRRLHIFKRRIFITKSRLFQRLSNAEMAWEGSLKLAFTLTFLLVPTWTVAQQTNSDNSGWLFPSDSDLVSAARYGYQGEGNLDLDYAYVKRFESRVSARDTNHQGCRPIDACSAARASRPLEFETRARG